MAGVVTAQAVAGEVKRFAIGAECAIAGLADRQGAALQGLGVDGVELCDRLAGLRRTGVQNLALGAEAPDAHGSAVPTQALGYTALHGHQVDVARAVVLAHKSQPLAVGGDGGLGFLAAMGGQALSAAAVQAHPPQIAFGHQHHLLALHGGLTIKAQACDRAWHWLRQRGQAGA